MNESLKAKTLKGVVWSSVERFSVAGLNFIFGLILARILAPSDYGVIAMLAIFMSLAQTFIDSGFSNALIRKPDRTEKDNATTFYFNIVVGLICYLLLFFCSPLIADFYDTPILIDLTRVLGLNLLLNSLCVVQQAMLTVRLDFKTQAKISLSGSVISGIAGVVCAYYGMGVWALVVQSVGTSTLRTILLWILAKWKPSEKFSKDSFCNLFSYGSKLLASGLLDTIYNNLYTIIIGKKFSAFQLGTYSRGEQWANFPAVNITGILQRVTFPVLSTIQNEDDRLRTNYRKFIRFSGFVIFPIMVGIAAVADPLTRLILTDKWEGSIIFTQMLCFAFMWYPIHAINLNLLQVKGRSDLFLRLEIIKKVIGVVTLVVTVPIGLTAMCVGRIITSLISLFINTYYTGKLLDLGYVRQMKDLLPALLISLSMGILVYFMVTYCGIGSNFIKLVTGVSVGFIYYLSVNVALKTNEWMDFLTIILKR